MTKEIKRELKIGDKLKRTGENYEQVFCEDVVTITELCNFSGDNYPSEIRCNIGGSFKYDLDKFELVSKKEQIVDNYSIY